MTTVILQFLGLKRVPPVERFNRAMANVETRIAVIEQRLRLHVPPPPVKPVRVRVIWRAQETEAV